MRAFFMTLIAAVFVISLAPSTALTQDRDLMKEYQQIIPRGRIAAIMEPVYVPAKEAQIADDAWVLGVVIDKQARAYSLTLLNSHEIVNDKIGETAFAAVW